MSTVPDSVLRWLYNSLRAEYRDVDRTYSDVAQVLTRYPSLSPRTEVYTFENGSSALLLVLKGTLPVQFRGTTYRFPIAVWIPHGYAREPPMIFVTPVQEMSVRPGQHVSVEGRVYHPYLAHWDSSNLDEFLSILSDVFSKEPPVIARQSQPRGQPQSPHPELTRAPPPVPANPNGLRQPVQPREPLQPQQSRAPIPPPKPSASTGRQDLPPRHDSLEPISGAPPLPPKPGQSLESRVPQKPGAYNRPRESGPPPPPLPREIRRQDRDQGFPPRPSPIPESPSYRSDPRSQRHAPFGMPSQQPPVPYQQAPSPMHSPYQQQSRPQQYHPQQQYYAPAALPAPPPQPKQQLPDLLSSPLDIQPPNPQSGPPTSLSAPPIPVNPEKDRLLSHIASSLHPILLQNISQNTSAIPALQAQQAALQSFHHSLTSELASFQSLSATLTANESILHAAMRSAETIERGLNRRELPNVDEVLVAPTVVGEQLYGLVAEERAVGDALFVLGRALDGGRVGGEVFVRITRGLAREQFLKRALVRKIAKGMGLVGEEGW